MAYEEAIEAERTGALVTYQGHQYYVVGHNELLGTVTIREASSNPMFTVPQNVKPEDIDD